jgi:hypothetical protein
VLTTTTGTADTTFCGRISDANDHDFWSYTFNITGGGSFTSSLTSSTTPGVTVKVSVNGGAAVDFASLSDFEPGKPYVFDVSHPAGAADYRITMSIKQN